MQSNFDIRGVSFSGCGLCGNPMPDCMCNKEGLKREAIKPPPLVIRIAQNLTSRSMFDQSRLGLSVTVSIPSAMAAQASSQAMGAGVSNGQGSATGVGAPSGCGAGGPG